MTGSSSPAKKAWATRRSAVYRARRTARDSQAAFEQWAQQQGWRVVFLDAPSGNPRTGIVDAVLLRVRPRSKDQIDVRLVQLKSGQAGLTSTEFERLCSAVEHVNVEGLGAFWDGTDVHTAPVSRAVVSAAERLLLRTASKKRR